MSYRLPADRPGRRGRRAVATRYEMSLMISTNSSTAIAMVAGEHDEFARSLDETL